MQPGVISEKPLVPQSDEDFWEDLLCFIEEGNVIPVVGSGVVTRGGDQSLVHSWLARRLAEMLNLAPDRPPAEWDLNAVALAHLRGHGDSTELYIKTARILQKECPSPGQALLDVAAVLDFNLYLTTTFDPLLQRAIDAVRYGGRAETAVYAYSPNAEIRDLPARRRDLAGTTVFHLLGRFSSSPDEYVVWEEDMLEFMFALPRHMQHMERLKRDLNDHGLLFLGLNFSDWLVRFLLRVSKQKRLSESAHRAYLADGPGDFPPQSLVIFFEAVNRNIRVRSQDPVAFCAELARRWKERHGESGKGAGGRLPPPPEAMSRGAVFVSYAREDEAAAANIVRRLQACGCEVWYDRERLKPGVNFHNRLADEVKQSCGVFLSVISRTTESTPESYYHLERNWAAARAERLAHGTEFYVPVVVDDTPLPAAKEPPIFAQVHAELAPAGAISDACAQRVLEIQRRAQAAPR